ncbi:MAG: SPFH domain-containing protein, partial [Bifidobacteriaceae bacterium]|nr:SPFH domain-containing protein [Bifidobacteriaceae bacterium]
MSANPDPANPDPRAAVPDSAPPAPPVSEHPAVARSAALVMGLLLVLLAAGVTLIALSSAALGRSAALGGTAIGLGCLALLAASLTTTALTMVQPGDTKVLTFFGRYVGTVRQTGLNGVKPLTGHSKCTVRVRNFETSELKVNDADGNPVNIAAIVVWRVVDTAKASFAVDSYKNFVEMQAESALRHVTNAYPYDGPDGEGQPPTLRGATARVSTELAREVAERVELAGVEIVEARISKLAYAPEIAQAMLQRQQAGAIIAAKQKIVEGAVGMVKDALARLDEEGIVELDGERRAAM